MRTSTLGRRNGVSELVATVLTLSITLIAGFSVFGYVNSQAGVSENQYGQAVGATVQYLEERFMVAQFAFSSGTPATLTLYFYNNGRINLQIAQIQVYDSAKSPINVIYSATGATDLISGCTVSTPSSVENPVLGTGTGAFSLAAAAVPSSVVLTLPNQSMNPSCPPSLNWASGTPYYALVTARYGNQVVYYQVR